MNNPLVTVNILSFNRKDELRITLTKVFEQDYKNIEVIVVDNASSDGTQEMVKHEFPDVKLIELKENIGIAGWNRGFEVAKGEYVLVLDDDSYPGKDAIEIVVDVFNRNPLYGALAFKVLNHYENDLILPFPGGWSPQNMAESTTTYILVGCAFAMRKNLYVENLFAKQYFIYFHEMPIILHIVKSNFKIFFDNRLVAHHINRRLNSYKKENECFHFKNMINFVFYCFAKGFNIWYTIRILLFYFTRSIRKKWFFCYLKSIILLKNNFISFPYKRFSINQTFQILDTGVIEYKLFKKITNLIK